MHDPGDTVTLRNELAYVDRLPVLFVERREPPNAALRANLAEKNIRLLMEHAALEEHGKIDAADEDSPHSADLSRLEQKVNLLLDVVGYLLAASQSRPDPSFISFNARAAIWESSAAGAIVGANGVLQIYLRDCLVQPLQLPGRVAAIEGGAMHFEFDQIPDSVTNHLEKMVFRHHRRRIAGARQARRS